MSEKELVIKASDCSDNTLVKAAKKCGLLVLSKGKHYKVQTGTGIFVTTIPRHSRLKRELVKGVVEKLNEFSVRKVIVR